MNIPTLRQIRSLLFVSATAATLALPAAQADFTLVDDFTTYSTGQVRNVAAPWFAHGNTGFAEIQADGPHRFLGYGWTDVFRGASRPLPAGTAIQPGEQATFFIQFRAGPFNAGWSGGAQFGLAFNPDAGQDTPFGAYRVQTIVNPHSDPNLHRFSLRDGGNFFDLTTLRNGMWYNLWYVIDRTDGDKFRIYLAPATSRTATEADRLSYQLNGQTVDTFAFRTGGSSSDALNHFMALGHVSPNLGMKIGHLAIDNTGENLAAQGTDFHGWQENYTPLASTDFPLDFGTAGAQSDGSELLRNRPANWSLQGDALRHTPGSSSYVSSTALAEVSDYLDRQDFTVEADLTLANFVQLGGARAGLVVLAGPHVPFNQPFESNLDTDFYSLVWFPEATSGNSFIQIRQGFNGAELAHAGWNGLHPGKYGNPNTGVNTSVPFRLKAEGVYDESGGLRLSFTFTDPENHSQTISANIAAPYQGNLFGFGSRSQREQDSQADPLFDFHNLHLTLGDEPGEIVPDPVVLAPFARNFGSGAGLHDGSDFRRNLPDQWSLETNALRLPPSGTEFENALLTTRVGNFSAGTDFFLRARLTVNSLDANESANRVGMVLFGNSDLQDFDATDDSAFYTFQWLPTSPAGGSLVVRQGMDGAEIARTDLASLAQPPVFAAGGTYFLHFEGRYSSEGDLNFSAYLLDGNQREAEVSGVISSPPSGNRFGLGARHRQTENAVWDFHEFSWTNTPVLRGQILAIAATAGQNASGTAVANAIGKRRADGEFRWFADAIVGTNGGEAERATNATFLLFELPARPTGAEIRDAILTITRDDRTRDPGAANVDLWGVGYQSDRILSSAHWHAGETDDAPGANIPATVKLHNNLVTPSTPTSQAEFTTAGVQFDLADFLNHLYDHGAQPGEYAVLRLSYDDGNLDLGVLRYAFFRPGTTAAPRLQVTMTPSSAPAGVSFSDWKTSEFLPEEWDNEAISGLLATPAGDGITNLMKYAYDLPAKTPVRGQDLISLDHVGGVFSLTYTERTDASDLVYLVEVSEDLIQWNSGGEFVTETDRTGEGILQSVTVEAISTDAPRQFMRLRVQLMEP